MARKTPFPPVYRMSPASVVKWLAEVKSLGMAKSDADCAALLGVRPNAIVLMKANGSDLRTALSCTAILHRMGAYK